MCFRILRQFCTKFFRQRYRFKFYFLVLCVILYIGIISSRRGSFSHEFKLGSLPSSQLTQAETYDPNTPECVIPQFPQSSASPGHKYTTPTSTPFHLQCHQVKPNWVYVRDGKFHINSKMAATFPGGIFCSYIPLERLDDYASYFGEAQTNFPNGGNITSDFFYANCNSADENNFYEMLHAGISPIGARDNEATAKKAVKKSVTALDYNVVLLGIDSLSKLSFMRNLPKSYRTFTDNLEGVVFNKFNTIGDGTTANLLALLTGWKETELPEGRRSNANGKIVDDYPWIWKAFKSSGYVTQWAEDGAKYGTFQYRLRGFREQPTDHYMRIFFLKAEQTYSKHYWGCLGSKPRHMIMLDWLREFYKVYDPYTRKFSLIFHSELSHEDNIYLTPMDDDLVKLLKEFRDDKLFKETILILFSDHGHRYANTRSTFQGKYEERLPFLGIHIPNSLKKAKPEIFQNLQNNRDSLVTLLDVHDTLKDILNFENDQTMKEIPKSRSQSLFQLVPTNRSCLVTELDAHWCACLQWTPLSLDNSMAQRAAEFMIGRINRVLSNKRMCSHLTMKRMESAELYSPRPALLKFKQSHDNDGRFAEFTDQMKPTQEVYRISVIADPGAASFEGTVYRDIARDTLKLTLADVSRTNKYGNTVRCLKDSFPELRKFCICKGF